MAAIPVGAVAQNTEGAEPGTRPSRVGGAPVTQKNTYEGELGRQSGNPLAAPGASTPMQVSTPLTTDERGFILDTARADVFQLDAANLAARKASSPQVKALAKSMLDSRARMRMALRRIAEERGVSLPSAPDARRAALLEQLKKASGAEFDRRYTHAAIEENRRDVQRFRQAAGSTSEDRRLRLFSMAQLPALEHDLREARATADAQRG